MHVLSCAIFVNAGIFLVTSEQNSVLCQGVDYLAPKKFQHVFIRELFFFSIFFSRLFVSKVRDTVVRKLCSFFSFAFISIVFPRGAFCLTKDVKKHTQKNKDSFFCVQSLRSPLLVYMQTICAPTQPMGMKGSWNN